MIGVGPNGNYESLWLDSQSNSQTAKSVALRVMQSDRFQSKLMKLIQHFDNANVGVAATTARSPAGSIKKSISSSSISNPISFSHVSHVDSQSNFGLEKSFSSLNLNKIDHYLPPTSVHRSSVAYSTNDGICDLVMTDDFTTDPYESVLDPATNVVKAVSTYRTSPTHATHPILPSHSSHSISTKLHRRTSSASTTINLASSQFSSNSIFTSNNAGVCSSDTSRGSSPRNSLKVSILPCIPQEDPRNSKIDHEQHHQVEDCFSSSEEENPFRGKFVSIPSAPPPPRSTVAPEDRLKSFMQREEIEIASDSEDEDICFEKFRLSSNIETITSEIQTQLQKRLNADKIIMNKECRESIMLLLKQEAEQHSLLENLTADEAATQIATENVHIPKSTARKNLSLLLTQTMEHIEEELEADDEGEYEDDEEVTEEEQLDHSSSVIGPIPFGDSTSLIDTTFDLDANMEEKGVKRHSVISDFFADLEIKDSTLLDSDDHEILDS